MPVIGFINQKGGCGKSTAAVHYICWLKQQGRKVFLVDSDAQRTSSQWVESFQQDIPYKAIPEPDQILEELPKLMEMYEWVVVDAPAALSEATRSVVLWCDLAVIPCQPTGVDLSSASDTVRLVRQAQAIRKGQPKALMFISRAIQGTRLKGEAVQFLQQIPDVTPVPQVIHQRQIVADAYGQASSVFDLSGKAAKEASEEYDSLFKVMESAL